jgi:hypothetical protein
MWREGEGKHLPFRNRPDSGDSCSYSTDAERALRPLAHDPEKACPHLMRGVPKRSCLNKKIERDPDSKKRHPALSSKSTRLT